MKSKKILIASLVVALFTILTFSKFISESNKTKDNLTETHKISDKFVRTIYNDETSVKRKIEDIRGLKNIVWGNSNAMVILNDNLEGLESEEAVTPVKVKILREYLMPGNSPDVTKCIIIFKTLPFSKDMVGKFVVRSGKILSAQFNQIGSAYTYGQ